MTQIENPQFILQHEAGFDDYKNHSVEVTKTFPNEYRIVKEEPRELVILNVALTAASKAIPKDQIIYLKSEDDKILVGMTNEDGKISSYTELERDKAALDIFLKLVDKSILGTLARDTNRLRTAEKTSANSKLIVQVIILILSVIMIVYGLKAFME